MTQKGPFDVTESSVQAHLGILQRIIQRMSANSASCKTWCITLVSAVLLVASGKGKPEYGWIAIIPSVLFLSLNCFYLAHERDFRDSYKRFVCKLHREQLELKDLYLICTSNGIARRSFFALWSFSIWPFYGMLIGMIFIIQGFGYGCLSCTAMVIP